MAIGYIHDPGSKHLSEDRNWYDAVRTGRPVAFVHVCPLCVRAFDGGHATTCNVCRVWICIDCAYTYNTGRPSSCRACATFD